MKRLLLSSAIFIGLLAPAAAKADYFISEHRAVSLARDYWHNQRGYHYTYAACRPQGASSAKAGYIYHRWTCGFVAKDDGGQSCKGLMLIAGSSSGRGSYYDRVDYRRGECP
jgi:hypothetical protein